jgi:hypothetical protein
MAKRKLTADDRMALRQAIRKDIAAGVPRPQFIRKLSQRYGLTETAIRWYARNLDRMSRRRSGRPTATLASIRPERISFPSLRRVRGLLNGGQGSLGTTLLKAATRLTEKELRRAIQLRELLSEFEQKQAHVHSLQREFQKQASIASRLKRRIGRLMKG